MIRVPFIASVDDRVKKKMFAGGIAATILAATMVAGLGVLSGFFAPFHNNYNSPIITIDGSVENEFAAFTPYDENFTPNAQWYVLNSDLSNLENPDLAEGLTAEQRKMLAANGFVVVPQSFYRQIYTMLKWNVEEGIPSFVTTDAVLHAFHVLYDFTLRQMETYTFWDLLGNLTASLLDDSYAQYLAAPEGRWKSAALRNVAYFTVAAYLMDSATIIKPEVASEVYDVLSLISSHSAMTGDWFMGYEEDFTQYVPRGHYTRSETLSRYFQAMMWYGRVSFLLRGPYGMEHTPQGILISIALTNPVSGMGEGVTGYDLWDAIYEPTAFIVGSADDLLPADYLQLVGEVYGTEFILKDLNNDTLLMEFVEAAGDLREPLIMGSPVGDSEDVNSTQGMRLMGQRFIPDSYILNQLVYNRVGTAYNPRLMPKGLDVMAALGSERAWELLEDQKQFYHYEEQMYKMWMSVGNITDEEWTHNLYYLWLYSLLPLLQEPADGFPLFMQSAAWVDKQLMTALASWTELRHDTILYAKQSYASRLSAHPDVQGFVEPVPQLYGRLASLCRMMIDGLSSRNLLSTEKHERLQALESFLLDLRSISLKELTQESLNETDLLTIKRSGSILEYISEPSTLDVSTSADGSTALVADVHTDPNTGMVLEEAVGYPMFIYVAVPVGTEVWLALGGTFSYYEFQWPAEDRLTDEAWQEMLDSDTAPAMPTWTSSFVVGESGLMAMAESPLSKRN